MSHDLINQEMEGNWSQLAGIAGVCSIQVQRKPSCSKSEIWWRVTYSCMASHGTVWLNGALSDFRETSYSKAGLTIGG